MSQETFILQSRNKNLLDNFGITVSLAMLGRYPDYAKARNALFGTHLLSRLWMKYIYPRFSPGKFKALCDTWNIEQLRMQQEFMIAVLEKTNISKYVDEA